MKQTTLLPPLKAWQGDHFVQFSALSYHKEQIIIILLYFCALVITEYFFNTSVSQEQASAPPPPLKIQRQTKDK